MSFRKKRRHIPAKYRVVRPRTLNELSLRDATPADIDALSTLEARSFDGDRLSRRSFRRLVVSPAAACRVAVEDRRLLGYALLLFRRTSGFARLYSVAIDPAARGRGLGGRLLRDAEMIAAQRGKDGVRLEVRQDNRPAIGLYESRGYMRIATLPGYYEDGAGGLRLQKTFSGRSAGGQVSRET